MSDVMVKAGSREWAVVQAMRDKPVRHVTWSDRIYAKTPGEVLYMRTCPDGWELYEEPEPEIPRGTIVQFADGMLGHYLRHENGLYWAARDSWNHDDMAYQDRPTPLTCPK